MDESGLLDNEGHNAYQHLVGIFQWLCTIRKADIQFSVCSLSIFSAFPYKGQLKAVNKVFDYLKDFPDMWIKVDHGNQKGFPVLPTSDVSLKGQYSDAFEEFDEWFPIPVWQLIQSSVFFDLYLAYD